MVAGDGPREAPGIDEVDAVDIEDALDNILEPLLLGEGDPIPPRVANSANMETEGCEFGAVTADLAVIAALLLATGIEVCDLESGFKFVVEPVLSNTWLKLEFLDAPEPFQTNEEEVADDATPAGRDVSISPIIASNSDFRFFRVSSCMAHLMRVFSIQLRIIMLSRSFLSLRSSLSSMDRSELNSD